MIFLAVYLLARCLLRSLMVTASVKRAKMPNSWRSAPERGAAPPDQPGPLPVAASGWLAAVPADPPPPVGRGLRRDSGAGALPWATSLFTATALAICRVTHRRRRTPPRVSRHRSCPQELTPPARQETSPPAYPRQRPQILAETRIGEYDAPARAGWLDAHQAHCLDLKVSPAAWPPMVICRVAIGHSYGPLGVCAGEPHRHGTRVRPCLPDDDLCRPERLADRCA
jgi:hypothetical protein